MTHDDPSLDEALARYLGGDASDADRAQLRAWADRAGMDGAVIPAAAQAMHGVRPGAVPADDTALWAAATRRMTSTTTRRKTPVPRRIGAGVIAGLAAAAVAVTVIGANLFSTARTSVTTREYATAVAQHATVQLPDGTRAMLAPETRLRYSADGRGARTVELEGQAYFTVEHDPNRPFAVRSGPVTTRVLGTAFEVRHYRTDRVVRVAVVSGKVATQGRGAPLILTPGTTGQLTDSTATMSAAGDPASLAAWTQGRLVFANTPVPVMLETVGRWYGYRFRLADSTLAKRHVSVWLSIEKPEETIHILKGLLDVTMTFDGTVVTLRPARGSSSSSAPRPREARDTFSKFTTEVGQ